MKIVDEQLLNELAGDGEVLECKAGPNQSNFYQQN